ncbi:hypothetical protein [Phycisphaera mikurensis]|uniref:Uncharacterized protein n=1 Tax=Phycisphaera mikurensis (strain NBRC 102666 / KCTC 22515 / FYK2301M01) TaxID=1142394 RepID=I0IJH3_PHYMF|nr:hypothetical protein [Phycisphaera mikurensis]MBB6443161.1 putative small lipoprotein YifL [Phycisphaera mikurensis]BAM05411.1 hypothetical protein PSMK_p00490 [Phycisphaera mikurensis NBRC 102666]
MKLFLTTALTLGLFALTGCGETPATAPDPLAGEAPAIDLHAEGDGHGHGSDEHDHEGDAHGHGEEAAGDDHSDHEH